MFVWRKQDGWQRQPLVSPLAVGTCTLVPFADSSRRRAALVVPPGAAVAVNGYPPLGVVVLEHRDEITIGGERLVFTAYVPTEPASFEAGEDTRCARCKKRLRAGDVVVRCPACGAHHHEGGERNCWSYDELGGCGHSRAALAWTPEDDDDDESR